MGVRDTFCATAQGTSYLQEEQEFLEQELFEGQEAVPAKGFSTPLIPKTESFLTTSAESHSGQAGVFEPKTSFSNSMAQEEHLYS